MGLFPADALGGGGAQVILPLVPWMRSRFSTETDFLHILVPTLIQGGAMAYFFIPLTTITLSGLAPERIPAAAGLNNFVRIMAGAMGVSIATTLWDRRAALHHAHLAENMVEGQGVFGQTMQQMQAAGLTYQQALAQINRLMDQQAFTRAADDVFLASAALFLLLIGQIWFTKRPSPDGSGTDAAANAH